MATEYASPRLQDELAAARVELSIYDGLVRALNDAHGALEAVLSAADGDGAREALRARFDFDELQAAAVLDMQFRWATSADREGLDQRCRDLRERVGTLEIGRDTGLPPAAALASSLDYRDWPPDLSPGAARSSD